MNVKPHTSNSIKSAARLRGLSVRSASSGFTRAASGVESENVMIANQAKAPKIQAAMRRELERLAKENGQQRGMFLDTSGNLRCEAVSATAIHSWIFKTESGKPFHWNQTAQ